MKPFFPDKVLHRYTLTQTNTGIYGETILEPVYSDDILVDFQNETNNEVAKQYGCELADLYRIYLDINTTLNPSDQLRDDNGNKYSIIGGVQEYPKFHKYKKAHLVLQRRDKP